MVGNSKARKTIQGTPKKRNLIDNYGLWAGSSCFYWVFNMRIERLLHLLCVVIMMLPVSLQAQERARFDHFTTKDGLQSNRIYSITQDSLGFIWMSTDLGVCRFDGTKFRSYQRSEYPDLARDEILSVAGFDKSVLVGSSNGILLQYDVDRDRFVDRSPKEFDKSCYKEVRGFYLPKDKDAYAFTVSGIYQFNRKDTIFTHEFEAYEAMSGEHVRSLYVDEYERFWVGTLDKLLVYDKHGTLLKKYEFTGKSRGFITNILRLDNNRLLVSSFSDELWVFDVGPDLQGAPTIVRAPFTNVMTVMKDSHGRFWFPTDGCGLWYSEEFPNAASNFISILPYGVEPTEMKKIYSILEDRNGDIWVGTQCAGLWRYCYDQMSGELISSDIGFPPRVCSSFVEDDDGTLYVGTDGDGVYSISPDFKKIEHLPYFNKANVLAMSKAGPHEIWVATWGDGMFKLDVKARQAHPESFSGIENPVNCALDIVQMSNGEVWVASAGDGAYYRDTNGRWHRLHMTDAHVGPPDLWPISSVEGKDGTCWMLTTRTLWQHSKDGKYVSKLPDVITLKTHNPLVMADALVDDDGTLYVAGNEGIVRFYPTGEIKDTLSFLPAINYATIRKDATGRFWVSSSEGIFNFDPNKEEYNVVYSEDQIYYARSGCIDSRNRLFFGARNGFVSINLNPSKRGDVMPYFAFSELFVERKRVEPYAEELRKGSIAQLKHIELKAERTEVVFTLDRLSLQAAKSIRCAYRLEGLKDEWLPVDDNGRISFSYIPPGEYELQVKATILNDPSFEKKIALKISVLPPWWASWWFRLLVMFLLLSLISVVVLARMRSLVRQRQVLEEKVEERTSELKRVLCDKDRLISVIAHDLKNPMFAIVGALEGVTAKVPADSAQGKVLTDIYGSAKHLQDEMVKLLDWARSKRDDIVCHPTDIDLGFVANNAVFLLRAMMEEKHIKLEKQIDMKHRAYADSRMIGTVIRNALSNSIKFTPREGTITIKAWEEAEFCRVEITDTGRGMSETQLAQLETEGYCDSTLGTEKEKGTGLGFRICQDYMLRNNGKMEVRSTEGKGTTVSLIMPLSEKPLTDELVQHQGGGDYEVDGELLEGNTVLVVDDDPLIRMNMKGVLESYMKVLTASDGKEGLALTNELMPDLVLSDVEMPEMNGIEMCREISKDEKTCHIPLLILSARNDDVDRLVGLQSGAIDYISKPFSNSELLLKIANILKIRQHQQQRILAQRIESTVKSEPVADVMLNPFVASMMSVMEKRYADCELTMEALARELCVSQSTLLRRVKSVTGKTPIEILVDLRLTKAMELIKSNASGQSIGNIAYEAGFNDPSYFARKFKEHFGVLPSQV